VAVTPPASFLSALLPPAAAAAALTAAAVLLLARSPPLQRALVFGHVARFPRWAVDHTDVRRAGLATLGRNVTCVTPAGSVLRGWHLAPPGRPFPPPPPHLARPPAPGAGGRRPDGAAAEAAWHAAVNAHYDARLATEVTTPVFVFFHGNGGTRGTPPGRVHFLRTLSAHTGGHVVAFDLGGFADSTPPPPPPPPPLSSPTPSRPPSAVATAVARAVARLFPPGPTASSVAADAVAVVDAWVAPRVGGAAGVRDRVIPYGHSLGSVAALAAAAGGTADGGDSPAAAAAAAVAPGGGNGTRAAPPPPPTPLAPRRRRVAGLLLSAPIANLPDAAGAHWLSAPLRLLPGVWAALADRVAAAGAGMDNEAAAAAAAVDLPLLVVHGGGDRVVPVTHGRRVAAAAVAARRRGGSGGGGDGGGGGGGPPPAPVRFVETDASHNANYAAGNFFPELAAWLEGVLAPVKRGGEG